MEAETLNAALATLARPDATASSAHLIELRDNLDLPGAQVAIELLEERRYHSLLKATDAEIREIDTALHAASLDLDRRRAAAKAMEPLIDSAKECEALEGIRLLGIKVGETLQQLLKDYVALDSAATQLAGLLEAIGDGEAFLKDANTRLRTAGRQDLVVAMPLDYLVRLAQCEFERLPRLVDFTLPGYKDTDAALRGDIHAPRAVPLSRRFGRLAEMLPADDASVHREDEAA